jgi:hypothetical protein
MKRTMNWTLILGTLILGSFLMEAAPSLHKTWKANIPFDFYVNSTKLSSGDYMIRESGSSQSTLLIQKNEGADKAVAFAIPESSSKSLETSNLIFHKYSDTYFLSSMWSQGNGTGLMIPPSKMEKELVNGKATISRGVTNDSKEVAIALK